jgi:hypothetical protein
LDLGSGLDNVEALNKTSGQGGGEPIPGQPNFAGFSRPKNVRRSRLSKTQLWGTGGETAKRAPKCRFDWPEWPFLASRILLDSQGKKMRGVLASQRSNSGELVARRRKLAPKCRFDWPEWPFLASRILLGSQGQKMRGVLASQRPNSGELVARRRKGLPSAVLIGQNGRFWPAEFCQVLKAKKCEAFSPLKDPTLGNWWRDGEKGFQVPF